MPDEHPAEHTSDAKPWLIAAWPGMGNVAVIVAGYLVQQLGLREQALLPSGEHFDISDISVKNGVMAPVRLPRGLFFRSPNPKTTQRELIVFLGEAQPATRMFAYAQQVVQTAASMGVERVVTFASMASALHPSGDPKVTGVATNDQTLDDLRRVETPLLEEGQISGLNGVLLAAAAAIGVDGMCLLAEIPFFAANVPNPKAARAALSVFSVLAGIDISLDELSKHVAAVDTMLIDAFEKLQAQGALPEDFGALDDDEADKPTPPETPQSTAPTSDEPTLDFPTRQRIERLFEEARQDRAKALSLKQELDRLGVFKQYEDRFLDLFRRAG